MFNAGSAPFWLGWTRSHKAALKSKN